MKIKRGAKKCAKLYRNGIGIDYAFSECDKRLIKEYWDRRDKSQAKRPAKRRRGNDSEPVAVDEEEQKQTIDLETEEERKKEDPKVFRWNEEYRQIVFGLMIAADYMRLDVQFREFELKRIRTELVKQSQEYMGLTTTKMKDCFIKRKRYVLKLYNEDQEFDRETLFESEKMMLQYLIESGITGAAVRLTGFAS